MLYFFRGYWSLLWMVFNSQFPQSMENDYQFAICRPWMIHFLVETDLHGNQGFLKSTTISIRIIQPNWRPIEYDHFFQNTQSGHPVFHLWWLFQLLRRYDNNRGKILSICYVLKLVVPTVIGDLGIQGVWVHPSLLNWIFSIENTSPVLSEGSSDMLLRYYQGSVDHLLHILKYHPTVGPGARIMQHVLWVKLL